MYKKIVNCLPFIFLLGFSSAVHSAAFQLGTQSAASFGRANAGSGVSDDVAVQFWNPAAITQFDQLTVSAVGAGVFSRVDYDAISATDLRGRRQIEGSGNRTTGSTLVPAFYVIYPINDRIYTGLGVTVPFGLSTNYGKESKLRYFATSSSIKTYNINPNVAFKLNDYFSIGVGANAMKMQAELNQTLDFKGFYPAEGHDIYFVNKADSWAYGWNAGLMFEKNNTKVGLSYRSGMKHKLKGTLQIDGITDDIAHILPFYGFVDALLQTEVNLPDTVTLSLAQIISEQITVYAELQWIGWSVLDTITLNYSKRPDDKLPSPKVPPTQVIELFFKDSWRASVGGDYQVNERLRLRAGVAFDGSPVNPNYRTVRLPGTDRYWAALGLNYKIRDNISLDLAYMRVIFESGVTISQKAERPVGTQHLHALFRSSANIAAAQITITFD